MNNLKVAPMFLTPKKEKLDHLGELLDAGHFDRAVLMFSDEFEDLRPVLEGDHHLEWKVSYLRIMAGVQNTGAVERLVDIIIKQMRKADPTNVDLEFVVQGLFKSFCECSYFDMIDCDVVRQYLLQEGKPLSSSDIWHVRALVLSGRVSEASERLNALITKAGGGNLNIEIERMRNLIQQVSSGRYVGMDNESFRQGAVKNKKTIRGAISDLYVKNMAHDSLSMFEQVSLKCYPSFAPESFVLGNRYTSKLSSQTPHFTAEVRKDQFKVDSEACWIVSANKPLERSSYKTLPLNGDYLDLFSGVYVKKDVVVRLSPIRQSILINIFSAGELGIHELTLIDRIYGSTFYAQDSGKLRTRNLVAQIKYLGFEIKRVKNYFKFIFDDSSLQVILPCDHQSHGILHYVGKMTPKITAKNLGEILEIKPSTAWSYIVEWKELNFVQKDESCSHGEYLISKEFVGDLA